MGRASCPSPDQHRRMSEAARTIQRWAIPWSDRRSGPTSVGRDSLPPRSSSRPRGGVMEVSYVSVAELCRASVSSIQRRFPTAQLLRRATLEAWLFQLQPAGPDELGPGLAGMWDLLCHWFHAHARHPIPFALLNPPPKGPVSPEWEALREIAVGALLGWHERLRQQAERVPAGQWRQGIEVEQVVRHLFAASTAHGPSAAVLGEVAALEVAASWCLKLLLEASADEDWARSVTEDGLELVRHAGQLMRLRPSLDRIEGEAHTAEGARPHRGGGAARSRRRGPATWDAFLAEASEELDEYRKTHREGED